MDENEVKDWALIGIILLVGFGIVPTWLFEWFLKNVFTPIGKIENLAWALSSPNPWDWVLRLTMLLIIGSIIATVIERIREKIGL